MAWARANTIASVDRAARTRRSAEARRCPKCKRKGAISRIEPTIEIPCSLYVCRWQDCQWGGDLDELLAAKAEADVGRERS